MKMKKISLALGLLLALPSIGLISCGKKKEGYTVKVSVTDIGTAKVYLDTLKGGGAAAGEGTGISSIKDSLISKLDSNKNGAKITSVKVTYIDEKGKKIEDKNSGLDVNKEFTKTYQVAAGKTIIVTAEAVGSPVGDTTKVLETAQADALKAATTGKATKEELAKIATLAKAWEKLKVPGQPAEVTLPTLSITIEKDGETIAAQSVKASKNGIKPEELTKAGNKTTVTATATAVAFEVK